MFAISSIDDAVTILVFVQYHIAGFDTRTLVGVGEYLQLHSERCLPIW